MSMMTSALDRKRGSSVSFTKAKDSGEEGTGEIHISLAPYVQTYLAHSGQGLGCCGISLPIPFERAAPRSWWNPKFDSEILEEQYKRSAFLQIRLRFRYALIYILLVSLSWLAYFVVIGIEEETTTWPLIAIVFGVVGLIALSIFFLTHTDYYRRYVLPISVGVAVMLCLLSLVFLALVPPYVDGLTLVGHFALCTEILLLIYTVLPMPLYACVGISALYSFAFEFLTAYLYGSRDARERFFSEYTFLTPGNATNNFNRVTTEANIKPGRGLSHGSSNASSSGATGIMTSATTAAAARDSILLSALGLNSLSGENLNEKLARLSSDPNLLSKFNASALSAMNNATFKTINASIDNATVRSINFPNSLSGMTDPFLEESNNYSSSLHNESYTDWGDDFSSNFFIRILMQLCIHLIGVHILIMTFVRMRGTFMKVGQSLLVRRQLEMEKQLKEKMIHSVMPPKVADWLMQESEREREREDSLKKGSIPSNNTDIRSLFRPFNMHSMENVSILFADIVGFTKMSSNKTAEELVGILNDLFERFDELCEQHGCEKISTLGDCYYCVTGCPEPRPDHAKCCIEMGLAMIEAIKQFDIERREGVNMRVGVHTGTVLCGIVGTKRFKFDVWSNDVTLANKLESTGKPGRVHLSQQTLSYLNDQYITEEGEIISDVKTYFVKARKSDILGQFAFNSSPKSVSPIMQTRHRLASYNNQSKSRHHYLHMVTNANTYKIKANSLPSILDSENDGDTTDATENASKSPVSIGSYGKRRICQKPWKYLQRQRTTEEMTPLDREEARQMKDEKSKSEVHSFVDHNGFRRNSLKSDVEMDPNPLPSSPLLSGQEVASCTSSVCSRKDSGIRSTSRRSSIQQQLFLMNGMAQGDLLTHRVSGYYTSSSTLNSAQEGTCSAVPPYPFPPVVTDTFGACFHKLRKQSDLQLIRCVQDNVSSQRSYFVKPPLSGVTLFFKNKDMEKEYRENAHKINECSSDNPPTLATSRFNTYFDILISALVYTAITASLFLLCEPTLYYVIFFSIATLIQVIAVTLCVRQLLHPNSTHATVTQKTFKFFSRWYPWHTCGAILVGLPITSILLNFSCNDSRGLSNFEYHYGYLVFVGLVHFCNFTQVNCWMKNLLVTVGGVLFLCLIVSRTAQKSVSLPTGGAEDIVLPGLLGLHSRNALVAGNVLPNNVSSAIQNSVLQYVLKPTMSVQREAEIKYKERLYNSEIFLDMLLLVLLVWFLNREFEISYRLSFHGNAVAARDKSRVQSMKNQADWLLHNIIPKYVADQLKTTAKYSQNHKSVGIIFASIVNFNELYDESYLRGKEYLRVLNELIGDFDELLEKPEYANVEKIKTIGSTFMAASGLNPQVRQQSEHEYTHLFQLMDFALAMHKVIIDFNQDLLGFKLILRIGYNYGDVTAGVIGATKLYYDIWGDAVNIASRMDSTGVAGRVQVASNSLAVLSDRYEFEPRGKVYVKGKDDMDVFLLLRKKGEPEDKNEASSM